MNKILQLFDEKFVLELLKRQALPQYTDYKDIKSVKIHPYKKMVWDEDHYHVVIEYITDFIRINNQEESISIFCSAHYEEPREHAYKALQYLWGHDFPDNNINLPRPLFFSSEFNGLFYQGIKGDSLYEYIKRQNLAVIEKMVIQTAKMFAKLHQLPASPEANFNPVSSRIETSVPGVSAIYQKMFEHYGQDNKYSPVLKKMYDYFIAEEEKSLAKNRHLCLIHGDAHSENIIRTGEDKIGLIDFTDACLGDFARDLGTFLQQFEYKMILKVISSKKTKELKDLFLNTYLTARHLELTEDLRTRINLYYNWTAIRSAIFLFLKDDNDPSAGEALFEAVKIKLNL